MKSGAGRLMRNCLREDRMSKKNTLLGEIGNCLREDRSATLHSWGRDVREKHVVFGAR